MAAPPLPAAGSLTDWLRSRTDADLAELLRRRPDRALPAPADLPTLAESREYLRAATVTLPWDGLKLSRGEPAIPTRTDPAS